MKRRDFIKTIGMGCMGCFLGRLDVLRTVNASPEGFKNIKAGSHARVGALNTYRGKVSSLDNETYDKEELLKEYDSAKQSRRDLYVTIFGEDAVDSILDEMRDSYETIIPDIPYVGERNFHLVFLMPNAENLADYLVAKSYGVTVKEFSKLHLDKSEKDLFAMPEWLRLMIGRMQFGLVSEMMMRRVADRSQQLLYPEDYICTFVKGDGEEFDWGLDYTQCSSDLLYIKYDANDLSINLTCNYDYIAGKAFKIGYSRTMIIPEGDPICDLRWKWGEESEIPEL